MDVINYSCEILFIVWLINFQKGKRYDTQKVWLAVDGWDEDWKGKTAFWRLRA